MNNSNEEPKILPRWNKVLTNRRDFQKLVGLSFGALTAVIAFVPTLRFIFGYLFRKDHPTWLMIGPAQKFQIGQTVAVHFDNPYRLPWDGVTGNRTAWLRRVSESEFTAFAINCTHLGCPVRWEPDANLFMCPCHGGVYYSNGDVAGGPPPRPLHRYPVRIRGNRVEIEVRPILTA